MTRRRWLLLGIAGVALALLLGRAVGAIYTDYLWYAALGAADVWRAKFAALAALRLLSSVAATLFVFANLYAVRQSVVSLVLPRRIGNLDIGEEVPRRQLTWTAAALSLAIGIVLAWPLHDWSGYLAARFGEPFGETDPYFASDLGFFVYWLPFELTIFEWMLVVVLVVIGIVLLLYALTPSLRWEQGTLYVSGYVRRHFAMLAGVLLLCLAWHYRLQMYTILGDGNAMEGAFGYLDHRVGIPANLILALVTLGAALTVLWAGWTGQMRLAFAAITAVLVAVLAARQVAPFLVKRTADERDPTVRERPYEATRAGYSRRAFALDRVATGEMAPFRSLSDAAPLVPIWDEGALRQADGHALPGAAVGWALTDSGIVALLPVDAAGGIASYAATSVQEGGTPERAAADLPSSFAPPLFVPDSSARARVVADSADVLAAPLLAGPLRRFAHALSMQDFRLWFGALPGRSAKIVTRRSVRERVEALAPVFAQGSAITPVWVRGSLSWAVHLYSTSATYPLSRRVAAAGGERAYFQHAATALVDAGTGRTTFVLDSAYDPIAATWLHRFPKLFIRAAALPPSVLRQLPPARESARAQAATLGRFGLRGEAEIVRHIPDDEGPDSALAGSPAPLIGVPGASTTAYVLPLLDRADRLRGLFVALGGGSQRTMWIPASDSAPVWNEALDRLRAADTTNSPQLVRGYVRMIPLAGDMAFVQPRYDWRGGTPRLAYVSALVGDTVRTARTLLQLAGRMPAISPLTGDWRAQASALYEDMRRAMVRGDWAAYGRAFEALGALLARARQ